MTNSFCKVHNPFRDENGNCFWNGSSPKQGSYICQTRIGNTNDDYYHINPNMRMSYISRGGFICSTFLGRCLIYGIFTVGMIIGCSTIYILAAKLGRRFALAFSMLATFIGYLYPMEAHYSLIYISFFLSNFEKLAIVQICYTYLAEMGSLRKEVFSIGPFSFTYNSFIGTSFAIPFYLGGIFNSI